MFCINKKCLIFVKEITTKKTHIMTNSILNKVNELSRTESFSQVSKIKKTNGAKMLVLASSNFNVWISFATGKFYADDNNGNWFTFKN